MKNILWILLLAIIITSCKKRKIENAIEGWWTMDTIYYKNYNIRSCLGNTSLFFKFEDKSEIPAAEDYCGKVVKNSYDRYATISILPTDLKNDTIPYRLKITTDNNIFSGIHKIVFYKDMPNHLLKMEIFSDNLYIVCRKGLFNFDGNIDLMNELEKISWTNRPR